MKSILQIKTIILSGLILVNACDFSMNLLGERPKKNGNFTAPGFIGDISMELADLTNDQLDVSGSCVAGQEFSFNSVALDPNTQTFMCASSGTYVETLQFFMNLDGTAEVVVSTDGLPEVSDSIYVDSVIPIEIVFGTPVNGSSTNDTTPTVSGAAGSAENGAIINVSSGASSCSVTAAADGSWTCDLTPALSEGNNQTISVTQTDPAGNTSPAETVSINVDITDPAAVTLAGPADGSSTNDTTPAVSGAAGSAENGATINVSSGASSCSATAAADGSWTCDLSPALSEGNNQTISVTQTDPAGNTSPAVTVDINVDISDPSAVVIAGPTDGSSTSDTTPGVSGAAGSAENGATINVSSGASSCSTTAAADGSWSCDLSPALSEGNNQTISVTQTDAAGNTSPAATVDINVDTSDPSAVIIAGPADGSSTNDTTPTVSGAAGSAESGAAISVVNTTTGLSSCSTTAAADGSWTCDLSPALSEGNNQTISVTQTDAAGNTSPAATVDINVDLTDPSAVIIATPLGGSDINDTTPNVSGGIGSAENGATITVTSGASSCTTLAIADGSWNCDLSPALSEGDNQVVTVTQTDLAGNTSTPAQVTFDIDTTDPSAVVIAGPADGSSTNDTTPTVEGAAGSAENGATIMVTSGASSCTTVVAVDGSWSCDLSPALSEGNNQTISVTQTDSAGNTSPAATVDINVDTSDPSALVIAGPIDGSSTNDTTPTVNGVAGSAENGATVNVTSGASSCSTTAAADGSWSCDLSPALSEGNNQTISATQTDAAGNTSSAATVDINVDTSDPSALVIAGPIDGSSTNDTTPTVNGVAGSAENGATVNVTSGASSCSTTAAADGSWSCDLSPALGEGNNQTISATQTDAAGNTSPAATVDINVDTSDPSALIIAGPIDGSSTNDTTPTVNGVAGSAENGATVNVTSGASSCSTTAAADGSWSCDLSPALSEGNNQSISATQTDAAGNTSPAATVDINVDTTDPSNLSSIALIDPGTAVYFDDTPTFQVSSSGTFAAGETVTLYSDASCTSGNELSSSTATVSGNSSVDLDASAMSEGAQDFYAQVEDLAGNTSNCVGPVNYEYSDSTFFACSSNPEANGVFDAGIGPTNGNLIINILNAGNETVSITANQNGFTANFTGSISSGDSTVTIPVTYDGSGSGGLATFALSSSEILGSCTGQAQVASVINQIFGLRAGEYNEDGNAGICARNSSDEVYCWGTNNALHGGGGSSVGTPVQQTGFGAELPFRVFPLEHHGFALMVSGKLFSWGNGSHEALGRAAVGTGYQAPAEVVGWPAARTVRTLSGEHTDACVVLDNNDLWCWGANNNGELGIGSTGFEETPVFSASDVQTVYAGGNVHCYVQASTGDLYCAGKGTAGQLGNGVSSNSSSFVQVTGINAPKQVSIVGQVGTYTVCAIKSDNTVWCWGEDNNGQLGNGGSNTNSNVPTQVVQDVGGNLTNVTKLASGHRHTCALKSDGTIWCWGDNNKGQIGLTIGTDSQSARQITIPGTAVDVGVGQEHSCAFNSVGDIYCWGNNGSDRLGYSGANSNTPIHYGGGSSPAFDGFKVYRYDTCGVSGFDVYCSGTHSGSNSASSFYSF